MLPKFFFYFIFILLLNINSFGQTGNISGRVIDSTGQALIDVQVYLRNSSVGALTDSLGNFEIKNVPQGDYDIIFQSIENKSDTLKSVKVFAGKNTVIDKELSFEENKAVIVTVVGIKKKDTDASLIEESKKSSQIITGITSEQINKGQDRDASEALKRIPGAAINNDQFIVIRGINERYNTVWINNSGTPGTEIEKKAFSFDVLPSTFIDRIIVYKTPTADLPGDFAGGLVKITTKTAPLGKSLTINFNSFYRPGSTFNNYTYTQGSKTDFLGFDNGFRAIPNEIPSKLETTNAQSTNLFKNTWVMHNRTAVPDLRFSMNYSIGTKVKSIQIGSITGINYAYQTTIFKINRQHFEDELTSQNYNDVQNTNYAKLALIQNFSVVFNNKHSLEFKNLFSQIGRSQATIRTGQDQEKYVYNQRYYAFGYQSRTLFSSQLEGNHNLSKLTNYTWALGYSYSNRNDPDLRRIYYQQEPDGIYRNNIPAGTGQLDITDGASRYFSNLNEHIFSFNQNIKRTFSIDNFSFELNAGTYIESKNRDFTSRFFGYLLPVTGLKKYLSALPVNTIFDPSNIYVVDTSYGGQTPAGFLLSESINPGNSYQGQNRLIASYLSSNFYLRKNLHLLVGVRYENNVQAVQGYINEGLKRVTPKVETNYFLPSFNLKYEISEKSILRLVYGKTLNRPEFREWSPFTFYNFDLNSLTTGSLYPSYDFPNGRILKTATIQNVDLRYEFYPSKHEVINFGIFYKYFQNPIEQVQSLISAKHGEFSNITYQNTNSAYCAGMEVEFRKNFAFLDNLFKSKIFSHFDIIANASIIKSRVSSTDSNVISKPRPLQGQAPYLINTSLYYQNLKHGIQASLIYNVIGARIFLVSIVGTPNVGEMPRNTIDFTISKNISSKVSLNFGIQDILNQPVLFIEDTNMNGKFERHGGDHNYMKYRKGSYYTFGIKIQF